MKNMHGVNYFDPKLGGEGEGETLFRSNRKNYSTILQVLLYSGKIFRNAFLQFRDAKTLNKF